MSAAIAAREEVGMRSVKPGRGPSMMGGIGAVIAIVFGVVWTLSAAQMGAPGFFPLFGVLFILVGAVQAMYNYKMQGAKFAPAFLEDGDWVYQQSERPEGGCLRAASRIFA